MKAISAISSRFISRIEVVRDYSESCEYFLLLVNTLWLLVIENPALKDRAGMKKTVLNFVQYFILIIQKNGVRAKYTNPGIVSIFRIDHRLLFPVINSDFPDPGILRLPDGSGYLGVVSSGNAPDAFPLIWSLDLVTWRERGNVFPNHSWPQWAVSELWAPEIHFVDGK